MSDPRRGAADVPIDGLETSVYTVPTDRPESDGTLEWDHTTLLLVGARAGGQHGIGYSYTHRAAAAVVADPLAGVVRGLDAMDVPAAWDAMLRAIRNFGRAGIVATAISAVDAALWDLKARLLGLPLVALLGGQRRSVPVYGSGGFTSYSIAELQEQLGGWVEAGFSQVKMKVGREPEQDARRVRAARQAIGGAAALFVDANGAYPVKQALTQAARFAEAAVCWFEEPVSSDDPQGLRAVREGGPAGLEIAAGEYGYEPLYFRRLLDAQAVDVLQADATRCLGITGFLRAAALCDARMRPLSAHCAPALHLHVACAAPRVRHIEYFHDHVRIENLLFEGAQRPSAGQLRPDLSRPGLGLELRRADAERYAA